MTFNSEQITTLTASNNPVNLVISKLYQHYGKGNWMQRFVDARGQLLNLDSSPGLTP